MDARDCLSAALLGLLAALAPAAALAETGAVPKPLSQEWAGEAPRIEAACETGDLRFAAAPLFRIAAGNASGRVHFFAKKEPCRGAARCPHVRAAYLVSGDVVFAGPEDRGFRCVAYGTRRGALIGGFVPATNLMAYEPETKLERAFLLGAWRRDESSGLEIRADGAAGIEVSGNGYWQGVSSVNIGEFSAKSDAVASPVLVLREEEDGCTVVLERRGPYLLVNDNARCGGRNVRFVGIYIRQIAR
jgi:hypothetical protein